MKSKKMNLKWFKSVMILIMIISIYKIMSMLDVYAIACSLLVVVLTTSVRYALIQSKKDTEIMRKPKPLQFQHISRPKNRFNALKLEQLRKMDPFAFERYCAKVLRCLGYKDAYATQEGGDGGKDIIFTDSGKTFYSECKRFGVDNSVGRPIVQKLVGSALADGAIPYAIFTTGRFTKEAIEEAKKTGVKCVGPIELLKMIELAERKENTQLEPAQLNVVE